MPQSFSKRGSAICTGSAEVTEGCHMRFAEYATRILALLQEDGMGQGKTSIAIGSLGYFETCRGISDGPLACRWVVARISIGSAFQSFIGRLVDVRFAPELEQDTNNF